jgi:hypothetical protein
MELHVTLQQAKDAWDEVQRLADARASLDAQCDAARACVLAAGDDDEASHYRDSAEERLLELAGKGSAVERAQGERDWLVIAKRRLAADDVWSIVRVTLHLKMKRLPDEVAAEIRKAWVRDRLGKLCVTQERTDGGVATRWRVGVVPSNALEAFWFARESYRQKQWAQVLACTAVVEATRGDIARPGHMKAEITRYTRWVRQHSKILRVAALHFAGTPDLAALRKLIETIIARAEKVPRDAYALPWDNVAALLIAHGLVDSPADAALVRSFAVAWKKGDWHAAPALLASSAAKSVRG